MLTYVTGVIEANIDIEIRVNYNSNTSAVKATRSSLLIEEYAGA
jgi:hypothetical protein